FHTQTQLLLWQQQLNNRIQSTNESVSQYAADIRSLLHKIDPDNTYPTQYKIREFTKGLNPQYAFFINLHQSETFEKAISIAIKTETGFKTTYNNPFTLAISTILID
ncbi:9593_t:CDS:2, partial [Ambispora gerdemannii]